MAGMGAAAVGNPVARLTQEKDRRDPLRWRGSQPCTALFTPAGRCRRHLMKRRGLLVTRRIRYGRIRLVCVGVRWSCRYRCLSWSGEWARAEEEPCLR
jgi:hypothetical protein